MEVLAEAIQQEVREGKIPAQVALKFLVPVARQCLEDWTSYPTIRDWREQSHAFEDLDVILASEAGEAEPEKIQGAKNDGIRLRLA